MRHAAPLEKPAELERFFAAISYEASGRRLVGQMKFRNRRGALAPIAHKLARVADLWPIDCVTWIPASKQGRLERGFDAGQLLAREVAGYLDLPTERLLVRHNVQMQTTRSRDERLGGPALTARPRAGRIDSVLVVDDVCTTGASMTAAANALKNAGVIQVSGVAAARTPLYVAR